VSLKFLFLSFFLLSSSWEAIARNKSIVVMGGGGEPAGRTTIFDPEIKNIKDFVKSNHNWKASVSYNGGHAQTEAIIKDGLEGEAPNRPFTQEAFDNMIKEYERKILNGKLIPGDQLLVVISSHGAAKKDSEKTHRISTSGNASQDLLTLEGSNPVSLDKLQRLVDLAERYSVKLGILDFSCHSGNTLALSNPNTCIISSSSPDNFGWAGTDSTFSARFTKAMAPGKSLEDAFLHAFKDRPETSFPMISSPVGKDIQDELYPMMSPYLYFWQENSQLDKLSPHLEQEVLNNQCDIADANLKRIMEFSTQAEAIVNANSKGFSFFKDMDPFAGYEDAIKEYYQLQKQMRDDLKKMNLKALDKKERLCTSFKYKGYPYENCSEWNLKEIATIDYSQYETMLNEQLKAGDLQEAWAKAGLENVNAALKKREELFNKHPEVKRYSTYYKDLPALEKKTRALALNVSRHTQKLYTQLYQERAKVNKEKNPCKSFVL
jgi:hypothetical protein